MTLKGVMRLLIEAVRDVTASAKRKTRINFTVPVYRSQQEFYGNGDCGASQLPGGGWLDRKKIVLTL